MPNSASSDWTLAALGRAFSCATMVPSAGDSVEMMALHSSEST